MKNILKYAAWVMAMTVAYTGFVNNVQAQQDNVTIVKHFIAALKASTYDEAANECGYYAEGLAKQAGSDPQLYAAVYQRNVTNCMNEAARRHSGIPTPVYGPDGRILRY